MMQNWTMKPIDTAPKEQGMPVAVIWESRILMALYCQPLYSARVLVTPELIRAECWKPARWSETFGWCFSEDDIEIAPTHWLEPALDEELKALRNELTLTKAMAQGYGVKLLEVQKECIDARIALRPFAMRWRLGLDSIAPRYADMRNDLEKAAAAYGDITVEQACKYFEERLP